MGEPDHVDLSDLSDNERAEVIDMVARLRARKASEAGQHAEAVLADLDSNPAALARFKELVQIGIDDLEAGRVVDGPSAMAAISAKYRLDEAR